MNTAHLHLLLNPFPIIGTVPGTPLPAKALIRHSDQLTRVALGGFRLLGLIGVVRIPERRGVPTTLMGTTAYLGGSIRDDEIRPRVGVVTSAPGSPMAQCGGAATLHSDRTKEVR